MPTTRRQERALARLETSASTELARLRAFEAVEVAKHEVLGSVTTVAMSTVAHVGMAEAWFVARAPHTAHRQALIADEHAMAAARRVHKLAREL